MSGSVQGRNFCMVLSTDLQRITGSVVAVGADEASHDQRVPALISCELTINLTKSRSVG